MPDLSLFSRKPEAAKLDNGSAVSLRRLSAGDKLLLVEHLEARKDGEADLRNALDVHAFVLSLALADESGERFFKEPKEVLDALDIPDLTRLGADALKLNGLGGDATEKKSPTAASGS